VQFPRVVTAEKKFWHCLERGETPGAPGSGAPKKNRNAFKHGLFTRGAIEQRKQAAIACRGAELRAKMTSEGATCGSAIQQVTPLRKPVRMRDRNHLRFVSTQPCLACGRIPSDAHHLRFAEQRALGRKVSDEFTVPLCRLHHREITSAGTNSHGGSTSMSIRWTRRNGCGEQLTEARRLKPQRPIKSGGQLNPKTIANKSRGCDKKDC
jgi:hypothetical protein